MKKILLGLALSAIAAGPASAITTFATFSPNSVDNIAYTGASDGTGSITSVNAPVTFHFLDASGLTAVKDVAAVFNFTASTGPGTIYGGVLASAPVTSGTFSFTADSATTYNGHTGTNLLSGTFHGGLFTGLVGGSVGGLLNSLPPGAVTFASNFFDFSQSTARDISLTFNGINPPIGRTNGSFTGTASGNFGADSAAGSPGAVPEPASWALMVAGFGLVGAVTRRRSPGVVVAA